MPKSLRCACCGSHAVDRGEPIEPDGWYEPFCSTCQKPLTREGLLVDTEQAGSQRLIKEIGKGAEVIWEYSCPSGPKCQPQREDAMRLLAKLAQLEERAKALGKAVEIKQAYEISWNRKAAARRFRRWFEHDYGKQPIVIGDFDLMALAKRILNTDAARQPDYDQLYRDMIEDGKYLDEIYAYEERKASEPALVFRDLPEGTRAALREAQEAYRWGLSRSVVATCRAVLEDVLRQVVTTHGSWARRYQSTRKAWRHS